MLLPISNHSVPCGSAVPVSRLPTTVSYIAISSCLASTCSNLQYIQPHAPQYMVDRYRKACLTWQDTKSLVQAYLVRPFIPHVPLRSVLMRNCGHRRKQHETMFHRHQRSRNNPHRPRKRKLCQTPPQLPPLKRTASPFHLRLSSHHPQPQPTLLPHHEHILTRKQDFQVRRSRRSISRIASWMSTVQE